MAVKYAKYINSTGTHYISNSGSDENRKYHGGKAGDQTGQEWVLKAWYNRPWTVVLRYPDPEVGQKIAELGCAAAFNNKVGYDQYQRTTYWAQLQKAGYDPSKITVACEADCTAGVAANIKAVGYIMDINSLKKVSVSTYSGNMKSALVAAGFKALTAKKYLTGRGYLLPGDILLYEGHHAATNITRGKYYTSELKSIVKVEVKPATSVDGKKYVLVNNGNYYVRTAAIASAKSIGVAKKGTKLEYLGKSENNWYNVKFEGQEGWISGKCGKVEG